MVLRDDLLTNLAKLGLIRDGKVTIAAKLLFGKSDFSIRVGRFKGADTIIDDNIVRGPSFSAIDEAMTFIKKHINLSYHFDGRYRTLRHRVCAYQTMPAGLPGALSPG